MGGGAGETGRGEAGDSMGKRGKRVAAGGNELATGWIIRDLDQCGGGQQEPAGPLRKTNRLEPEEALTQLTHQ